MNYRDLLTIEEYKDLKATKILKECLNEKDAEYETWKQENEAEAIVEILKDSEMGVPPSERKDGGKLLRDLMVKQFNKET